MKQTIICPIFGDRGTGKNAFQALLLNRNSCPSHVIIPFDTNIGKIYMDTESNSKNMPDKADVALIFFSTKDRDEYVLENIKKYCDIIRNKYGNIYIVI